MNAEYLGKLYDSGRYPYLEFIKKRQVNCLSDIMIACFDRSYMSSQSATKWVGKDKKQCKNNASRSRGDIYRIAKPYFKELTFPQFNDIFQRLLNNRVISESYCSTVQKMVCHGYRYDAGNPLKWDSITGYNQSFIDYMKENNLEMYVENVEEPVLAL